MQQDKQMESELNLKNIDTKKGHENTIYLIKHIKYNKEKGKENKKKKFLFATCSSDSKIIIWEFNNNFNNNNNKTFKKISVLKGHNDQVIYFTELKNDGILISTSEDNQIIIWDLNDYTLLKKINIKAEIHSSRIWRMLPFKFNSKSQYKSYFKNYILSSSEDKTLKIFDFYTQEIFHTEKVKHNVTCMIQYNTMGNNNKKYTNLINKKFKNSLLIVTGDAGSKINIFKINFFIKSDQDELPAYNGESNLTNYKIKDFKLIDTFEFHGNYISEIIKIKNVKDFDNKLVIATASADETINIIDIDKGNLLMSLKGHVDRIYTIMQVNLTCFWDGNKGNRFRMNCLISGGKDKMLKIWNLETGKCFKTLNDHKEKIKSLMNFNGIVMKFIQKNHENSNFNIDNTSNININDYEINEFVKTVDFISCDSSGEIKVWGNEK
jgi:WD40 repeat protein